MLRATLALMLLTIACSIQPPAGLIDYRAVPVALPDGETRTRSLMITADRRILGLERSPAGVEIRTGTASGGDYENLRTALAGARHLRGDAAPSGLETPTFQIYARLGEERIDLIRDPRQHIEKDVQKALDALEAIWAASLPSDDPVAGAVEFLSDRDERVRGSGVRALLRLWGAEKTPEGTRVAAEAVLRAHLTVERDRLIINGIRDVIDQPEPEKKD